MNHSKTVCATFVAGALCSAHGVALASVIRADLKKWEKVIRDAGIKLEGGA